MVNFMIPIWSCIVISNVAFMLDETLYGVTWLVFAVVTLTVDVFYNVNPSSSSKHRKVKA